MNMRDVPIGRGRWSRRLAGLVVFATISGSACATAPSSGAATATSSGGSPVAPTEPPAAPPGSATGGAGGGVPTADELAQRTQWRGQFTVTIEVWEPCPLGVSDRNLTDTHSRQEAFSFATDAPFVDTFGNKETNPFYVSFGSQLTEPSRLQLTVFSAGLIQSHPEDKQPALRQYWDLSYSDGELHGLLVDDASEIGVDTNRFYDDTALQPCQPGFGMLTQVYAMQEGATLSAEFTADEMTMVAEGRSRNEARRWRLEATAARS